MVFGLARTPRLLLLPKEPTNELFKEDASLHSFRDPSMEILGIQVWKYYLLNIHTGFPKYPKQLSSPQDSGSMGDYFGYFGGPGRYYWVAVKELKN